MGYTVFKCTSLAFKVTQYKMFLIYFCDFYVWQNSVQ